MQRHGVPRFYSDVDSLLNDPDVNAVYVATPPGSHLELAKKVAKAGKPCYMEKPVARSAEEAQEMADMFAGAKLPLFVAYYRRAYPRYEQVRALLEDRELGELSEVRYTLRRRSQPAANWRQDVATSGGGLFVDVGSHMLDLLDFLLGPLRNVQGTATRSRTAKPGAVEDTVSLSFEASHAAVGSALWNFRAAEEVEILEIVGDRAKLTLPDTMNGATIILDYADGSPARQWEVPPPTPAVQEPLICSIVDALRYGDVSRCPSSADSGVRASRYLDAALVGFYGSRSGDFWRDPSTWAVNRQSGDQADVKRARLSEL